MSADTSPLSGYWRRQPVRDRRVPAATLALAAQLADELDRVAAGELAARLVLCRYTARELLAAATCWGLLSDETRRLRRLQADAGGG